MSTLKEMGSVVRLPLTLAGSVAPPFVRNAAMDAANWTLGTFPRLQKVKAVRRLTSRIITSSLTDQVAPRPHPHTLSGRYTSWHGLVDRSYTGRHAGHLPNSRYRKPSKEDLLDLFTAAPGAQEPCHSSSFLFAAYAQWFTDSFLRTSHGMVFDDDGNAQTDETGKLLRTPDRFRRNDSNHEIDLNQLYGVDEYRTRLLRNRGRFARWEQGRERGFLDYQMREDKNGKPQMYPPQILNKPIAPRRPLDLRPEFDGLHDERVLRQIFGLGAAERSAEHFAVGLEHGNSTVGNSLFNALFLREHNRVAKIIGEANTHWDDEQVFQTTRNTVMVIALNTVLSDYIRHISQKNFPIDIVPGFADTKPWYRPNRIAIEFNILYRWHELVPETFDFENSLIDFPVDIDNFRHNNAMLIEQGPEAIIDMMSRQRAGKLTLGNLPHYLKPVKADTLDLMRAAQLAPYNTYRERFGMPRAYTFEDVTKDPERAGRLKALYPDGIESLEWFVGMYAEDHRKGGIMGPLLGAMVANDAFTQALTNPLLANGIYGPKTFSEAGLREIENAGSLYDLIARNTDQSIDFRCSFSI